MIGMAERRVLDLITAAGAEGATSGDLMAAGITRSEATARPSHLGDQGLIVMLAEKRDRAHVWVLPQFVGSRPVAVRSRNAPKRTATTATSLDGRIYGFLSVQPATDYEVFKGLEAHYRRESGVSGNRSHLLREGMVEETGSTRMHGSARDCKVWQGVPGHEGRFVGADLEAGRSAAQAAAACAVPTPTYHAPATGYDPRTEGADCDHCPMRRWAGEEWAPVPAKRPRLRVASRGRLFLGEAPAAEEVKRGEPFVGRSGKELNDALREVRIKRGEWDVDNVIACRAPRDKYDLIGHQLRRDKRNGISPDHEQHPVDHCRPRLQVSLDRATEIVALGGKAAAAVLGGSPSILSIRGGPVTLDTGVKVLPTVHPAFVCRSRRWQRVFRADLRRAMRFFTDKLEWIDPIIHYSPRPSELRAFLSAPSRWWAYDVETDAREPMLANLRCLAISRDSDTPSGDEIMVVPFWLLDTDQPAYDPVTLDYIKRILCAAFTSGRLWVGHNAGWYDRIVIEQQLGVTPAPLADTILMARLAASELPKSLSVVGSIHTDVSAWKNDHAGTKIATGAQTDHQLWHYCAIDTAVTNRILDPLIREVRAKGQDKPCPARPSITLSQLDHEIQSVCAGMSTAGVYIDQPAQRVMEADMEVEVEAFRTDVLAKAPATPFENPASVKQVRDALYSRKGFDLDVVAWTDTGDPSTGDAVLRDHLMDPTIDGEAQDFVRALRKFRKSHKLLTGFVRPLKPRLAGGVIDDDGRLRVSWSSHIPVTGRLSSSQPMNLQNWPKKLRRLVMAEPGRLLVGADYDQLEGRIGAARWGLKLYLDAYKQGLDCHQITMEFAFGQRVWGMPGAPGVKYQKAGINGKFNDLRSLSKNYYYAAQFAAADETIHGLLRQAEDEHGDFLYASLKLTEVGAMSRKFRAACPELEVGWEREAQFYRSHGYNIEPITGRRRDFLDGYDLNEVVNFPVQSSAAGLVNLATLDVTTGTPPNYAGMGTGLIQQGHDALVLEVPEDHAQEAAHFLVQCMTQHYPAIYDVEFTAEAEIGSFWNEV